MQAFSSVELDKPYLFISYSRKDSAVVQNTLAALQQNHFRFWYDEGIPSGEVFVDVLAERIEQCAQMVIFLSANAVESKYVLREIQYAFDHDKSMIVVYLDDVKLNRKMAFLLGCIHAIHMQDPHFLQNLFRSITKETLIQSAPDSAAPAKGSESAWAQCARNFRTKAPIGKGGIGTVYLSEHLRTGKQAVIKYGAKDDTYRGSLTEGYFRTEKKILSSLCCPFVPELLDYFEDDQNVYLAETFVPGQSLAQLMTGGEGFTEREAVEIAKKLLHIMEYFRSGDTLIVHKDIKPSNIMLDEHGEVWLIDFGAGQLTNTLLGKRNEVFAATPGFAAPEQYSGAVDWRADQYGIGRTLHRLLTYRFDTASAASSNYPLRYYSPQFNPALEQVILKMTDPVPQNRCNSIAEIRQALDQAMAISREERLRLCRESDLRLSGFAQQENRPLGEKTSSLSPVDWFTMASDAPTAPVFSGPDESTAAPDITVPSSFSSWQDGETMPIL